jgi:APA family basic amino acid/polyamine antiporter
VVEQPTREGLIRGIRRWDLVAIAINSVIGAGIFGLPSEVFGRIGVYSLLAFVVCAAAVALIVLCFAEVSSRFSETGGPYLYAREAFGPLVGFEVGWMMWVARLTAFAANCNLFVAYFAYFAPWAAAGAGRAITITVIVTTLAAVNLAGVRDAAIVSNVFTVGKLVPLALFIIAGAFFIDPAAYATGELPAFGDFSASVLLLVYAFSAFEMAVINAGEARNPRRDMPPALLVAIAVVAVVYLLIQTVAIGTLPGLATAARPLTDASSRFMGPVGAAIITAGALISILGNLNVTLLVAPRLPFAMAQRGELPAMFAATHRRFHTPHTAIVATAAAVLVLTLSGTFVYAATISVIARLLSYAATCAALPVFRRRADAPEALFRAPAGVAVSVVALVLVAWLLSNSTATQARDAAIAAAAGVVLYAMSRLRPAPATKAPY